MLCLILLRLLMIAAQVREQKNFPSGFFLISDGIREISFLHSGLLNLNSLAKTFAISLHLKEQYCFHPSFMASLYCPVFLENVFAHSAQFTEKVFIRARRN